MRVNPRARGDKRERDGAAPPPESVRSDMTAAVLTRRIVESDPVRCWRLEELVRAGYSPFDALVLSDKPEVDLHAAAELLRNGCSAETAVRILL